MEENKNEEEQKFEMNKEESPSKIENSAEKLEE